MSSLSVHSISHRPSPLLFSVMSVGLCCKNKWDERPESRKVISVQSAVSVFSSELFHRPSLRLSGTSKKHSLSVWRLQDVTWDLLDIYISFAVLPLDLKLCRSVCVHVLFIHYINFKDRSLCSNYDNGLFCSQHFSVSSRGGIVLLTRETTKEREKYYRETSCLLPITLKHISLNLCSLLTTSPRCKPVRTVWENSSWRGR